MSFDLHHLGLRPAASALAIALAALTAAPAPAAQHETDAPDAPAEAGAPPEEAPDAAPAAAAAEEPEAAAPQGALDQPDQTPVEIIGLDGAQIGTANIIDVPAGGVLIDLQVEGLPAERWLAFHIHEGAECDPAAAFETAGGHFNPEGAEHGYFVEGGPHAGDMPNQFVPADGILRAQVFNHMVSLDGEQPGIRGRTLVIHDAPDDYETQPAGAAGGRIACGVIE